MLQVYHVWLVLCIHRVETKRKVKLVSTVPYVRRNLLQKLEVGSQVLLLCVVLTEPVDVYAKWIDSLEAANPLPYADPEEGDDEQKESDHDSDGY